MPRPKGSKNKYSPIKDKNKALILKALEESMGILAPALKTCIMDRWTFNKYYNTDPEFAKKVDDIREGCIDFVESALLKNIKSGNVVGQIFYLKTKGKQRGYIETTETNMNIDTVKIRYIIPEGETPNNQLISGDNLQISVQQPEVIENKPDINPNAEK